MIIDETCLERFRGAKCERDTSSGPVISSASEAETGVAGELRKHG